MSRCFFFVSPQPFFISRLNSNGSTGGIFYFTLKVKYKYISKILIQDFFIMLQSKTDKICKKQFTYNDGVLITC
ncbi:unnamed protein product [Bacillus thuringiensis DB27]|uniref:Uncharacterized protein n=1 Tax=Bacillus thuringiensis DB27 TaxID=1431339 RepID=W8YMH4_BACTU|nr:unnamed protein product [Bacillus thuringiensis DB27]